MAKILISGGSGLLGKKISSKLLEMGHQVVWLSRQEGSWRGVNIFSWSPREGKIDERAVDGVTHLIHLAGAGVMSKRWTKAYRAEIIASRVVGMQLLSKTFETLNLWPIAAVGASATGIYGGSESSEPKDEHAQPGQDFLADVCRAWERSYEPLSNQGCRTSIARLGIILSADGGALPPLSQLCRFHISAASGNGKQYFPWIHLEDAANFFISALFDLKFEGTYNLVAPQSITNRAFAEQLEKVVNKKAWSPAAPQWVLQFVLGERATAITQGCNVSPAKLLKENFNFEFPDIKSALQNLIR